MNALFVILSAAPVVLGCCLSLLGLLGYAFGFHNYVIVGFNNVRKLSPSVGRYSHMMDDDPCGFIMGRWFVGCIPPIVINNGVHTAYCFMSENQYASIFKTNSTKKGITVWERSGQYTGIKYRARYIDAANETPFPHQASVINELRADFSDSVKHKVVAVMSGDSGCGKSYIALLLAKALLETVDDVHLVDMFDPTTPGDEFAELYGRINPTASAPLIVVLEEVDIIVTQIHKVIPAHKDMPTPIRTKADWNKFFDHIDRGNFPHVIVLMTTNKCIKYFDDMCPSYMREGRVKRKYAFENMK